MFKKIISTNITYLIIIALMIVVQLFISYGYTKASVQMDNLDTLNSKLSVGNKKLSAEISKFASLTNIQKRAKKIGFREDSNLIYLENVNIFAQKTK